MQIQLKRNTNLEIRKINCKNIIQIHRNNCGVPKFSRQAITFASVKSWEVGSKNVPTCSTNVSQWRFLIAGFRKSTVSGSVCLNASIVSFNFDQTVHLCRFLYLKVSKQHMLQNGFGCCLHNPHFILGFIKDFLFRILNDFRWLKK
jgi:hypothetical protein